MPNPQTRNSKTIAAALRADGTNRVWLRVGTLFDGEKTIPNAHVIYDAGSILYVGEERYPPPPALINPGTPLAELDLPDFTLLPGLIDAHAHLFLEGGELDPDARAQQLKKPSAELLEAATLRAENVVRCGVVGIRDAGDKLGIGLALSKLSAGPRRPIFPYVDSPGPAIHHRGEYGGFMALPIEECGSPDECVLSRVRSGAGRIKLIVSGVIDFKTGGVTTPPQMSTSEIRQFVLAAGKCGKQTFAHATGDPGIENAIEGGVDSVEHGFFIRDDQLERMRVRDIAWVPTFSPVQKQIDDAGRFGWDQRTVSMLQKIISRHSGSLVKAERIGVTIIAGSDAGAAGVPHGIGLLNELCLMERAGLSSLAVLRSATGNSSRRLAFNEKLGFVKAGYRSRFILTQHSPLESVSNLRKEGYVVYDGNVYESNTAMNLKGM